jgi:hypothetical protein
MPNRYIRASAIESEPVNALTWQGEVFYRRLLNRADDFGRYTANTNLLRASLFPLQLDRVSVKDTKRLLDECAKVGLVFLYESQGKPLLVMNKWEKGRALNSEYAAPPPEVMERMKTYVYRCLHMSPTPTPTPTPVPDPVTDHNGLSPLGMKISGWFKRRASTQWSPKELKALKQAETLNTTPEDIELLEKFYLSNAPYRRHDIVTLLNNWNTEIDRARGWKEGRNGSKTFNGTDRPNPRNVGTIKGTTDYGEAGRRKLERQRQEREAGAVAGQVAPDAPAPPPTGGAG